MTLINRPHKSPPPRTPPAGPKPSLAMVQLPIFRVKHRALEEYLDRVYRINGFDFLVATCCKPGECPEYLVQAKLPETQDAPRWASEIRSGRRTRNVALILNVLCLDGYIPAGKYILDTRSEPRPIDVYTALMKSRLDPLHPDCIAFKVSHQTNRTFIQQAGVVDKMVSDAMKREQELLGR